MSHEHSTETATLDEANATAIVTIEGLALFCFNDRWYEGGFLRSQPHHVYSLTIDGIGTSSSRPIGGDGDIHIEVVNPIQPGILRYENGSFDREAGTSNDQKDFRWIADIEGADLHDNVLDKRPGPGLRRVFINAATFYTLEVRDEEFVRIRFDKEGEPCKFYGKHAKIVGATLACRDGGSVRIRTEGKGGEDIVLPKNSAVCYKINFKNTCPPEYQHDLAKGSDFRLFYKVLSDRRGIKYDLVRAVGPEHPERQERCQSQTLVPKFRDGLGLACDNGFLRDTSSLPS